MPLESQFFVAALSSLSPEAEPPEHVTQAVREACRFAYATKKTATLDTLGHNEYFTNRSPLDLTETVACKIIEVTDGEGNSTLSVEIERTD